MSWLPRESCRWGCWAEQGLARRGGWTRVLGSWNQFPWKEHYSPGLQKVHLDRIGLVLHFMELPASPFPSRFKVFADYEDYIKCQEKVNALYKVRGSWAGGWQGFGGPGWDETESGDPTGRVNPGLPFGL